MAIYFNYPSSWWFVIGIIYGLYFLLLVSRKGYKKPKEIRAQLLTAVFIFFLSLLIEFTAVSTGLWTYFPGNWPVILWFGYFGSALLGFQLNKKVEEILEKKR